MQDNAANCFHLTVYDVINYDGVGSATNLYAFVENVTCLRATDTFYCEIFF